MKHLDSPAESALTNAVAAALHDGGKPVPQWPAARRSPLRVIATKVLLHGGFLLVAICCGIAWGHFQAVGQSGAAIASIVGAAAFGFAPVRDLIRVVFAVEGHALHAVHLLGGLALLGLPVAGVVSAGPVLTGAARAPFALMAAAQAVMHQNHPRNAQQAAALRRFAESLPEVAQFTSSKNLATPANAARAVTVLTDILGKAQALGETELQSDPGFQSALRQVSTRFGANLGLDAVDLALSRLARNPATAGAVPGLRRQLAAARRTFAGRR